MFIGFYNTFCILDLVMLIKWLILENLWVEPLVRDSSAAQLSMAIYSKSDSIYANGKHLRRRGEIPKSHAGKRQGKTSLAGL
jgi:hypothetical protein